MVGSVVSAVVHNRLAAVNSEPERMQKTLSAASETSRAAAGPRLSPGTVVRAAFPKRTPSTVAGSATASSAWRPAIRKPSLPATPLPTAVHRSQTASTRPTEISLPPKTSISSRRSTIWAIAAVNPRRRTEARMPNPPPTYNRIPMWG
jgi:hypothetical protein